MQTHLDTIRNHAPEEAPGAPALSQRERIWLGMLALGPALLLLLRLFPQLDSTMFTSPPAHLGIAGAAALLGIALALLITRAAVRLGDARVLLIGLGLLSAAEIFSIHAISTPNVLLHGRGAVTGWSSTASLLAGAALLALSGLDLPPAAGAWIMRRARVLIGVVVAMWLGGIWLMLAPGDTAHILGAPLMPAVRDVLSALGVLGYAFAAWRHFRLYRSRPTRAGLAITSGVALLGLALVTQWQAGTTYSLSFWLYHFQEFAAFGVISAAVLAGYQRGQSGEGLLEGLFLSGTRARLQARYAGALETLIETIAQGERPGEAQRQSLQEQLGLAESQLQALEQAAAAVAQERRQRQELERLNAALRLAQQDKELLTQMVVHDLKNPLTALIGFLEMMRMGEDRLSPDQRLFLTNALRSGHNLSGLIGDVLDVAQLEEGKFDLNKNAFLLQLLLRECADEMGAWLLQEEKTIWVDAPEDLPLALADQRLMRRVLLNLISNAIKHTPQGTAITLRARSTPAGASVEIEDNGPGIAPEHLGRIFDRFSRLNTAAHARQLNTGLGLTFCRLAVEAHGGTIEVESEPGQGTTFRVLLPFQPVQMPQASPATLGGMTLPAHV